MARHSVSKLRAEQVVDQTFLISAKQLRSNRQGNLYLQFRLSDRSGTIEARMWNASEEKASRFGDGDYVRVQGTTQLFQGAVQLIAKSVDKVPTESVDENDFRVLPAKVIEGLQENLKKRFLQIALWVNPIYSSISNAIDWRVMVLALQMCSKFLKLL